MQGTWHNILIAKRLLVDSLVGNCREYVLE